MLKSARAGSQGLATAPFAEQVLLLLLLLLLRVRGGEEETRD